jgi:hypothetical protein
MLARQGGWTLPRIQAHLNAYLRQRGDKSVLGYLREGWAKGAARYRDAGRSWDAAASSSIHQLIEEDLAAGRLVWRRGKIVEAAAVRQAPARKRRKQRRRAAPA